MKEIFEMIKMHPLFKGIEESQFSKMMTCVEGDIKEYEKGDPVILAGDPVQMIGIVLSGCVQIVREDETGRQNLMAEFGKGELFAETLACAGVLVSPVTVRALEKTKVFRLNYRKMITVCSSACPCHIKFVENMLSLMAHKNLYLNQKIEILSKRTTRERLLVYFNQYGGGKHCFTLPFGREELAAYLCVDRSALSAEMSKMQREGMIKYSGNWVEVL